MPNNIQPILSPVAEAPFYRVRWEGLEGTGGFLAYLALGISEKKAVSGK